MEEKQLSATSEPTFDAINQVRRKEAQNRVMELNVWMVVSVLVAGGIFFDIVSKGAPPFEVFSARYLDFLLAFATFFFPIIFRLIFGVLPLEALRRRRAQQQLESPTPPSSDLPAAELKEAEIRVLSDALGAEQMADSSASRLFAYYAHSSRKLAQSIYNRAGVYLLVGVLVAFSGLAFFYVQTAQAPLPATDGMSLIVSFAPKFGILFFIEFVALFFLRQYRAAMDEFRYYEAIKRNREETLALIKISVDSEKPLDPLELVKNQSFFSKAGVLSKDQTSEIIESRKLEKNELELLEKVIDVVSRSKK